MKNKLIYSLGIVFFMSLISYGQEKQDIKVLYVGYSPEKPMPENIESGRIPAGMPPERYKEEYGKRMPAFKTLLETYFTKVTTVDPRDYNEKMSRNHDVTIFDQAPTQIKERVIHNDPETGKFVSMEPAKYVSDDFSSASVFIGHTSSVIGSSLGSKLDWYCLCLDRHAHHIKTEHEIFKGPFKTKITLEKRETPKGVLEAYDGYNIPKEIPMWEVDKEGYLDGKGFRIGMVARGWNFEDSPNSEIISGGVSSKQKTAVALGRHGNFFLWGFAGSPAYMTEEAKIVFVNAIVYTNKHKNDKLIVRKYNERIATKEYIDELLFYTTKPSYVSYVEAYKGFNKSTVEEQKKIKKKQAKGNALTEMEKMILTSKPQEIGTREDYLKKNIGRQSWFELTGIDTLAIRKYLTENRDYFYSEPDGFYDLKVDEDIKSLGIANTNIKVLDKAISMLETNVEIDKAYRILLRYTLEDFKTAKEWRTWYNGNKDNMFFTEMGGFVWLIYNANANANPKVRPRNEKDIALLKFK
ncbi:hypothetical protein [Flavivirga rizhaonensis]|uniref:Uncharacterized protein n=1 Tax=Flavivirga rizhaonensis TaxID=2559571 RepID=A0A4S1E4D3_9FLAO|nr:hypothetical protein [Flavivirga rizhaonensis]TGV04882.1 hypothetical protein EM932_01805 [Flavivirga rizhaonensis]